MSDEAADLGILFGFEMLPGGFLSARMIVDSNRKSRKTYVAIEETPSCSHHNAGYLTAKYPGCSPEGIFGFLV